MSLLRCYTLFHYLLFVCIQKIGTERSVSSIYHLLKGKKSIQTIQDGYLFELSFLFGIYPKLDRSAFDKEINILASQQYIHMNEENQVTMTEAGDEYYQQLASTYASFYFNGLEYGKLPEKHLQFLYLLSQTVTYLLSNQKHFIPIIDDYEVQQSVKTFLKKTTLSLDEILQTIYQDVHNLLVNYPEEMSEIMVDTFTTIRQTGLTQYQLVDKHGFTVHDITLMMMSFAHELTRNYRNNHVFQPFIKFASEQRKSKLLTHSAKQTLNMLMDGYSLQDIANYRKLRVATIEDHVIEIIYSDNRLDWHQFMSKSILEQIWNVIAKLKTVKLKTLKDALPKDITYFQIKLALALYYKGEEVS